jgi:hypothetical protein
MTLGVHRPGRNPAPQHLPLGAILRSEARQRPSRCCGPMNILGINSVYHDSTAALVVDGALVAASEEERFNRIKNGKQSDVDNPHQFPEHAIRFCLD